jgi:predicted acetyltransferase
MPQGMIQSHWQAPHPSRSTEKMMTSFAFIRKRKYVDGDLQVVLKKTAPADPVKNYVPGYEFEMREAGSVSPIGSIRLRIGRTRPLVGWCGHIGYGVDEKARGKHYAARSCRLLFPLAYAHGLRTIWITCDPTNMPSRRTCEIAGGEYVDTVEVPKGTEMYAEGKRRVRRYRFNLKKIVSNNSVEDIGAKRVESSR